MYVFLTYISTVHTVEYTVLNSVLGGRLYAHFIFLMELGAALKPAAIAHFSYKKSPTKNSLILTMSHGDK